MLVIALLSPRAALGDAYDDAVEAIAAGDHARAVALLAPLAEDGSPGAQYQLASLYEKGLGVPHDEAAALTWFRAAAGQGFVPAQFALAAMYYEGRAVEQDYVRSAMWNSVAIANAPVGTVEPYERFRDALHALMTPAQIAEAATRARRCLDADFEACD